jgi:hypothetical protein
LFTEDSTKVYVYLEKKKSNTFDGFIGFSNNEKKDSFQRLDLTLENSLHVGEQFSLYWKNGWKQTKNIQNSFRIALSFQNSIGIKPN